MGNVISLADHIAARRTRDAAAAQPLVRLPAIVFFDVASPLSYLAAERADRALPGAAWRPVFEDAATGRGPGGGSAAVPAAEGRAAALGLPLSWPDRWPLSSAPAQRLSVLAAASGRGAAFAIAAGRLQFGGGFDLDDPEILAEAAAAAGLGVEDALAAADDRALDARLEREAIVLRHKGATSLPAFGVGQRLVCGEERLAEAVAAAGGRAPQPLAFWAR